MASIFKVSLYSKGKKLLATVRVHASHYTEAPAIALKKHKDLGASFASVRIV